MATTIEEFLVGLGFKVDESTFRRFTGALGEVAVQVAKVAGAVEAAAVGVVAAVGRMASVMDQLYFVAQRTGATVGGIQALGYAFSQMGLTAGQAQQAVEGMAAALRSSPGLTGLLTNLGVDTSKPTEDIVKQFAAKTANLPAYVAQQYAALFGIDANTLMVLRRGVGQFTAEYEAMAKRMGVSSKEASEAGNAFMTSWRGLTTVFDLLQQKVEQTLGRSLGADMARFKNFIIDNGQLIADAIEKVAKVVLYLGDIIIRALVRSQQIFDDVARWFRSLDPATKHAIEALAAFIVAWRLFNIAFTATPLGLIVAAVTALAAAILLLYDDYKSFVTYGADHALLPWDKIIPYLRTTWEALEHLGRTIRDNLGSWDEQWNRVKKLGTAFSELADAVGLGKLNIDWGTTLIAAADTAITAVLQIFKSFSGVAVDLFTGTLRTIADLIRGDFPKAWEDAKTAAWNIIKDFGSPSNAIWAVMPESWKQALMGMGQYFKDEFAKLPGYAIEAFSFLYDAVTKKFTDIKDWLSDSFFGWFKRQWDSVKDLLGSGDKSGYSPTAYEGPAGGHPAIQLIGFSTGAAQAVGGAVQQASMPNLPNVSRPGTATRGIRNNNPLNLSVAPGQEGLVGRDAQFGVYGSMQQGVAAAAKQLERYQDVYGLTTIAQIIERWSPGNAPGNTPAKTAAYIAQVAARVGVAANQPINLHDPVIMRKLVAAMARVEVGSEIDPSVIQQGIPGGGGSGVLNALKGATNAMANITRQASYGGLVSPAMATMPAGGGDRSGATLTQNNNIVIHGATDPKTTAAEIERAQDRSNANLMRNLRAVAI